MVRKHNIILLQSAQKGARTTMFQKKQKARGHSYPVQTALRKGNDFSTLGFASDWTGKKKQCRRSDWLEYTKKHTVLKNRIAQNNLQISFKFFVVATAASS